VRDPDSPVYAFLKNPSMVDFAGHLAAVFFTSGCNFRCGFCHNASLLRRRKKGIPWARLETVCRKFAGQWVDAAVITGGEPTLAPGLCELMRFFRKLGWAVKLDTNGSNPKVLKECLSMADYVAMDVKAGASRYPELTGFAETDSIAKSIEFIRKKAADYEFRTTVIEGLHNDSQMLEIGAMIQGARRYVLQPFVPRDGLPDAVFENMPRTAPDRLKQIEMLIADCADEVRIRGD